MNIVEKIQERMKDRNKTDGYYISTESISDLVDVVNDEVCGGFCYVYKKVGEVFRFQFYFISEECPPFESRSNILKHGAEEIKYYDLGRGCECDEMPSPLFQITESEFKELRKFLRKVAREWQKKWDNE